MVHVTVPEGGGGQNLAPFSLAVVWANTLCGNYACR